MQSDRKTVIVTGASQGIGAAIVQAFLVRGYNVVGTARNATKSKELPLSDRLALIDGDIGQFGTAQKVAELALEKFGSIDAVVANAGIFVVKPFTDYTTDEFSRFDLHEPGGLHSHHSARGQTDAGTEDRRQRRHHYCSAR
jgi:NAD(P)-dependent dehydrogenase (short-subunit alcohol dehydrogenase family)